MALEELRERAPGQGPVGTDEEPRQVNDAADELEESLRRAWRAVLTCPQIARAVILAHESVELEVLSPTPIDIVERLAAWDIPGSLQRLPASFAPRDHTRVVELTSHEPRDPQPAEMTTSGRCRGSTATFIPLEGSRSW